MNIVRETGLMNCILRGNTVILDFAKEDGSHEKKYHRYKTRDKAELMWSLYGAGHHMIEELEK